MSNGEKANDPKTPYYVYEFSFNGKVFYIGSTYHYVRSHKRWGHVANLRELEKAGTIPRKKLVDLNCTNSRVLAALIDDRMSESLMTVSTAYLPERPVRVTTKRDAGLWFGRGQTNAENAEKDQIAKRISQNCVLSNIKDLPAGIQPAAVDDVLRYIGFTAKK